MGWGDRRDRREQRRWQRELEEQLRALPTYEGETPDGGSVTPLDRSLPRPPRQRRSRRQRPPGRGGERRRTVVTVVVTLAVIGAVFSLQATPLIAAFRGLVGWDGGRGSASDHAYLAADPFSGDPVTWSSCAPIRFVVNPDGAPNGWRSTLEESLDAVSAATGLEMVIEGETGERPGDDRFTALNRPKPVLVSWATAEEVPELDGDTVGLAGPFRGAGDVYVTGTVTLDGPDFQNMTFRGELDLQKAVIMHELGHLVGLDHVDDDRQLMYPTTTFQDSFGEGDLEGLRELGDGRCV
ncbi:matrixin family metalloprotease [Nocardioides sp. C4-1]|uniref:matrixin family metalloprotease n=1 Tax=Nocardioides sp. C4-1 TaxID=3151851 RepID=UPI0032669D0B